jgi:hypothetical protein
MFSSDFNISLDTCLVSIRHDDCPTKEVLVGVWVILDRPPNDPFLRKKEPFTSSFHSASERGRGHTGGRLRKTHAGVTIISSPGFLSLAWELDNYLSWDHHIPNFSVLSEERAKTRANMKSLHHYVVHLYNSPASELDLSERGQV